VALPISWKATSWPLAKPAKTTMMIAAAPTRRSPRACRRWSRGGGWCTHTSRPRVGAATTARDNAQPRNYDATVVRLLLIPAAMRLLGERNWYLPSWLSWLPDLQVEGHQPPAPPADQSGHGDTAPKVPPGAVPVGF
jgi:hypothetical protein